MLSEIGAIQSGICKSVKKTSRTSWIGIRLNCIDKINNLLQLTSIKYWIQIQKFVQMYSLFRYVY